MACDVAVEAAAEAVDEGAECGEEAEGGEDGGAEGVGGEVGVGEAGEVVLDVLIFDGGEPEAEGRAQEREAEGEEVAEDF